MDDPQQTFDIDPQPSTAEAGGKAVASLVLGIISMIAWCLPIIGLPVAIAGLVLGVLDRQSSKAGMAIAGIVLSSVGLALSLINAALGILVALSQPV